MNTKQKGNTKGYNMKIRLLMHLSILLLASCTGNQEDNVPAVLIEPERTQAIPVTPSPDMVSVPDTFYVQTTDRVAAGGPDTTHASHLTRKSLHPETRKALKPRVITPGQNDVPPSRIEVVKSNKAAAGFPMGSKVENAYIPFHNSQSFSYYTRQHGLQHDDISAIAIDKEENMWIGTYGGGIIRFDGSSLFQYTTEEGLSQNYIQCLTATSGGDIWIGTRAEGAIRFDGRHFHYFNTENGLPDNRVEAITEDRNGNIWLGTYNGTAKYDGNTLESYTSAHLGADIVYVILEDHKGHLWFGTRGGGICRFDGQSFYQYTQQQGLLSDYVVAGLYDKNGDIWIGYFESGATRFDGTNFYHYTRESGLHNNLVRSFAEDQYGYIWMGSALGGLSRIKDDQMAFYTDKHGLINPFVTTITQDKKGIIWFGTYGAGLGVFQGDVFMHFYESHGLENGFVRSILQDNEGYLWFGTNNAGVIRYDGNIFETFSQRQGLSHNRVGSILQDQQGDIWLGTTGGGITRFDGNHLVRIGEAHGFVDDFILDMTEDNKGNIWFATRNSGIIRYDKGKFYHYTKRQGLSDNHTRCIMEDREGTIWIGTRAGGVNRFDGKNFIHFNEKGGLSSNSILDLMEDSAGNLWIATNGKGISVYDGEYFTHYTEREGLINNFVYSLLETRDGEIWAGTRMGLSKLIRNPSGSQPESKFIFKNYTQVNGFLGTGVNSRAMMQDKEGLIWIGANDQLTVYNPARDVPDTLAPRIRLNNVGLFNEGVLWSQLSPTGDTSLQLPNGVVIEHFSFDSVSRWYGLPVNLRLAYNNNYLTFAFAGVSSSFVNKVKYSYILEGYENRWSSLTTKNEISYGNLPPGRYFFKVKAINSQGVWSEEFVFPFRVMPPLWRTWWAWSLYALAGILLIFLMYKYQKNKTIRKELEKQREVYLQQEIALARQSAEFKQKFLANMSHEIRTPLTAVLGMAGLLKKLPLDSRAKEYIHDLNKAGESLRETINMILDISKIEAGKLHIRKSPFSLHRVIDHSIKIFSPLCKENVLMESTVSKQIPSLLYSDEQRISQIIKNLLSNAVKFTEEGTITLKAMVDHEETTSDGKELSIKVFVCDTGPGLIPEIQKKLFTPFYQANPTNNENQEGTGLGLAICKELALLLGGEIGVDSQPGRGSCFWFTFRTREALPEHASDQADNILSADAGKPLSILVAEDKPLIQKVIKLILSSMGHSVVIADNGQEAVKKFIPGAFDLILMDIQMPVMDGITATKMLRAMHTQLPPIVGLSANAFEGDRQKYMLQGLDEYITKPFKEKEFMRLLIKLGIN